MRVAPRRSTRQPRSRIPRGGFAQALAPMSPPVGIVLEGEAGIGKTALVACGSGGGGVRAAGASSAPVRRLLRPPCLMRRSAICSARSWTTSARRVPTPQHQALDVALLRVAPTAEPLEPRVVGAAHAAVSYVRRLVQAPWSLAIDDIQWLDAGSSQRARLRSPSSQGPPAGSSSPPGASALGENRSTSGSPRSGSPGSSSGRSDRMLYSKCCAEFSVNRSRGPRSHASCRAVRGATPTTRWSSRGRPSGRPRTGV